MADAAIGRLVLMILAAGGTEANVIPGPMRLTMPDVIDAVPGIETNIYFDDVVLVINPANYAFDVTCTKGRQVAERWTYTPAANDVGQYPLTVEVRDEANRVIARGKTEIRVVPANAGEGRSISALMIGDSLTEASVYPAHVLELCGRPGNPKVTLVGSYAPLPDRPAVRHEGYGGWTAKLFATHYTAVARTGDRTKRGSPFLYQDKDGKPMLNFSRYCQDVSAGQAPDFVTIFLGPNDVYGCKDENLEATVDEMLTHMDALIRTIHDSARQTRVGLVMLVPPAATQDAFGANYGCDQTRWQYKRNQHRVVERMIQRFAGREKDNVWLVPAYVSLDCTRNYPQNKEPWNARTTQVATRLANGVHPAAEGYKQIGDSVYCWLKARLAQPQEKSISSGT